MIVIISILLCADNLDAHERWILTVDEVTEWGSKPRPEIFSTLGVANISIVSVALLFAITWIWLGFTGARELFPDLQARLSSYGDYCSVILRFCLAWGLLSSAFALEPRLGNQIFASPTLFAPDLELRFLSSSWHWLRDVEIACAVALLLGLLIRFVAVILMLVVVFAQLLFGEAMFAYLPALLGILTYLFLQGAGTHYISLPIPSFAEKWTYALSKIPRQRAQFILRILVGFNILYLGIFFKVTQPNLALGIIKIHDVPILNLAPETFVFIMAVVEVLAGFFIIIGVLMRPMALILLSAFLFFSSVLEETFTAHIILYGVMLTFLFNSSGHWQWPKAKDKSAHIVILGGGFAAIRAAMKLEKLLGQFSNVVVTLMHPRGEYLFHPLLPEVIGGSIQPSNIVNPIRRVIPNTKVIQGIIKKIDLKSRIISAEYRSGRKISLHYDELIIAMSPVPDFNNIPGLASHSQAIDTVGDALHLRQVILQFFAEAEQLSAGIERQRLLTFAVIGGSERGLGTALEIRRLLNAASSAYREIDQDEPRILLFEGGAPQGGGVPERVHKLRDQVLAKHKITLMPEPLPEAVTAEGVVYAQGTREPCALVVNARYRYAEFELDSHIAVNDLLTVDDTLKSVATDHVWISSPGNLLNPGGFVTTGVLKTQGADAAYNAWAATQHYPLRKSKPHHDFLQIFHMGRYSIADLMGLGFSGATAWLLARLNCLATLPGLERNLRMVIDWMLDIPFRNDIAVLAPERTQKLSSAYYDVGDIIIRENEIGDTAYIIKSGKVRIMKGDQQVATLESGDCFGEIALLCNSPRTATVICETPVELTVLVRDQFVELAHSFHAFSEALRRQSEGRTDALK